jgi:molybdopterin adenylyltransferase
MDATHQRHRQAAQTLGSIPVAVLTVSDTRTEEDDVSGRFLEEAVRTAGHRLVHRAIVPDEPEEITDLVGRMTAEGAAVVLVSGGTGISRRDRTFETLDGLLERRLPGFGELFRMLSWEEIGSAAMLSRATAGVYRGTLLVSMPGSPAAVRLAWERLLAPELPHLVRELSR